MFNPTDTINETRTALIKTLAKRFGKSFDINEHEAEIIRMPDFINYERAIGTRYLGVVTTFRSLDGASYSKNQRVRITTACDLYLFDIVKK